MLELLHIVEKKIFIMSWITYSVAEKQWVIQQYKYTSRTMIILKVCVSTNEHELWLKEKYKQHNIIQKYAFYIGKRLLTKLS